MKTRAMAIRSEENRESRSLSHATSRAGDGTIDRPINRSRLCDSFSFLITMDQLYVSHRRTCNISGKRSVATEEEANGETAEQKRIYEKLDEIREPR